MKSSGSQAAIWLLSAVVIVATGATIVMASGILMLIFLGLLFGVFLTQCSELVSKHLPIGYRANLAIVTTVLLLIAGGTIFGLGLSLDNRLEQASERLDSSVDKLEQWLNDRPVVLETVRKIPFANELLAQGDFSQNSDQEVETESPQNEEGNEDKNGVDDSQSEDLKLDAPTDEMVQRVSGRVIRVLQQMLSTSFGLLANVGIIFFIGIFLAVDPKLYRDGFAKLFPVPKRERVTEVMDLMSDSMFKWIIGRSLAMLLTGVGTAIALWLLGVPMAITIGIATGLLTFVPNIGAVIALVLASLMALSQGPATVGWVILAYAAIQLVESNIISPIIQQYQTSIPPALLISFQLVFGALAGFLGIMIATPLLAAMLPLVNETWVKDYLGDGEKPAS